MDSSEIHDSTSNTGWRSITDLFEQVFGPDSYVSKGANTLDNDDTSTVATETSQNSYTSYINAHICVKSTSMYQHSFFWISLSS